MTCSIDAKQPLASIVGIKKLHTNSLNEKLASCPWGPATAHGVGLLTEMYAIYM